MKVYLDNKIQKLAKDNGNKIQQLKKDNEEMKAYLDNKIHKLAKDSSNKIKKLKKDNEEMKVYYDKKTKKLRKKENDNKKEIDKLKNKLSKITNYLKCPISQEIINDPVITPSGITYEKDAIYRRLIDNDTDPVSRQIFAVDRLVTNIALKNIINEFNKKEQFILSFILKKFLFEKIINKKIIILNEKNN